MATWAHQQCLLVPVLLLVLLLAGTATAVLQTSAQELTVVNAGPRPISEPGVEALTVRPRREFFVRGEPTSDTTAAGPSFRFLAEAVAAVRALPQEQRCGATVTIAGGIYTGDANAFHLTAEDSGCTGDPVVYRADPTDPKAVVLHGGAAIPPSAFRKEEGKTATGLTVWSADLAKLGLAELSITSANFKEGWTCANGNRTELFFDGKAMTLARHPNKQQGTETWQYLRQGGTLSPSAFEPGTDDTTGKAIPNDVSQAWAAEAADLWVHGFWTWDWADSFAKVQRIVGNGSVELDAAPAYGLKQGSRYLMTNAKSLLDAPSEYFIDTRSHTLYFIPPNGTRVTDPSGQGAFLSRAQTSHTMNGTSSVVIQGLRMEYAMGEALVAINITNVQIENCTISNSGTDGIRFDGRNSTLSGCDVYDVGCNAVVMSGGDIPSLTNGNISILNNTLHRFARVSRTVRVGVSWTGCGNIVSHNEVFDAPQIGMIGHGANMLFEYNDLHDLAKGTADTGGFYAGRTWADRGNIVRHNKFRRFYQVEKMAQSTSVNGIYLDDMEAGWLVEDNLFESIHDCMFIGGGRQNTVRRNVFINCTVPVHVDDRGLTWMKCGSNESYPKEFLSELDTLHYKRPPWSTEFPNIDVTSTPCAPTLNVVRDNRYCFLPPPPPAPHGDCATCPGTHPYPYGGPISGAWCCSVAVEPGKGCMSRKICCLTPGSHKNSSWGDDGCEGIARCGVNPTNKTACRAPPAPPAFTDYTSIAKVEWKNIFANNTEFRERCSPSLEVNEHSLGHM